MAEALLGGILEAGIASADEIGVGEPLEARRAHLEERYGLKAHPANADALRGADIAVLAVKPQSLPGGDGGDRRRHASRRSRSVDRRRRKDGRAGARSEASRRHKGDAEHFPRRSARG